MNVTVLEVRPYEYPPQVSPDENSLSLSPDASFNGSRFGTFSAIVKSAIVNSVGLVLLFNTLQYLRQHFVAADLFLARAPYLPCGQDLMTAAVLAEIRRQTQYTG